MSAKPKPDARKDSGKATKRQPKPFEPKSTQVEKKSSKKPVTAASTSGKKGSQRTAPAEGIPDAVSRRMIRRIAFFCGVPTALGMSTFVASYLAVSQDWINIPTYMVLLVSVLWFGLGVVGVSYGVLSASWDEAPGSRLGFAEFRVNWGRMVQAWRDNKQSNR